MNPLLTPSTALTPCYNAAGQLWTVRIAKGQPGAGQFTGLQGLAIWESRRTALLQDQEFVAKLIAAISLTALIQASRQYLKQTPVRAELHRVIQSRNAPLQTAENHDNHQIATVNSWTA